MQNNSNKTQHKGHKVSNDLVGLIATSNATVNDWSVMSKFLSSQDKEGVYTLQSFEQAMELVTIPTFRTVIFLEKKGKKNKTVKTTGQVCNESLDLQQRRYETVRRTFFTFHAPNTGFPQYLDDLYQPVLTGEQMWKELESKSTRPNKVFRYQTVHLVDGTTKQIKHELK